MHFINLSGYLAASVQIKQVELFVSSWLINISYSYTCTDLCMPTMNFNNLYN